MKMPKVIADVLAKQKGTITSQDINALGISRTMLGRYVSAGLLERVGRGLRMPKREHRENAPQWTHPIARLPL